MGAAIDAYQRHKSYETYLGHVAEMRAADEAERDKRFQESANLATDLENLRHNNEINKLKEQNAEGTNAAENLLNKLGDHFDISRLNVNDGKLEWEGTPKPKKPEINTQQVFHNGVLAPLLHNGYLVTQNKASHTAKLLSGQFNALVHSKYKGDVHVVVGGDLKTGVVKHVEHINDHMGNVIGHSVRFTVK